MSLTAAANNFAVGTLCRDREILRIGTRNVVQSLQFFLQAQQTAGRHAGDRGFTASVGGRWPVQRHDAKLFC